ncbi:hypothetical protein JRQ81_006337 [Phrynocephalus forsythii]|uniref:GIY-YIG domain-containing protein n=1 Tax=Phrynocephalus forsythii TaxID=171643 RepID=A0A9Q0Y495_9SAUR|nr:hypothetical protein JRQ81_006337 [Phrynocephalus forsythii]
MDKVLKKHNLQTVFRTTTKIQQMLWSAKDKRNPFTTAGVYRIACSCGQVYFGTTKCSIQTRIKEHERHCRLKQPEKSAVAEHTLKQIEHEIFFQDTEVLDNTNKFTMSGYIWKPLKCTNTKFQQKRKSETQQSLTENYSLQRVKVQ